MYKILNLRLLLHFNANHAKYDINESKLAYYIILIKEWELR